MPSGRFEACLPTILTYEGGTVDDPRDPGGRTNQGITQRVYGAWLVGQGKAARDVYGMTSAERDAIYRAQYWNRIDGDRLPVGVDLVVFDGAVNSGVQRSVIWLQRALGIRADGSMGEVTLSAVAAYPDHDELIARICARRLAYLKALRTWRTYGNGWSARVALLRQKGQAQATGSIEPEARYVEGAHAKARLSDARKAPPRAPADALASGGVVTTGLTTAQQSLAPLQGHPWADRIVAGLVALGAIAGVVGLAYGLYARRRAAALADALDLAPVPAASALPANDNAVPDAAQEAA